MNITIRHHTRYRYDQPVFFGVQRLHLRAQDNALQTVEHWDIDLQGATEQLCYADIFGNTTDLIKLDHNTEEVAIAVEGAVTTCDRAGVFGFDPDPLPAWFYRTLGRYTASGTRSRRLVERWGTRLEAAANASGTQGSDESTEEDALAGADNAGGAELAALHELVNEIRELVSYEVGGTKVDTTAEEALRAGSGVCQDHSHIMISVARQLGYPARYVSGYLLMDDVVDQAASHAWCEVFLERLGWVGFDVSNGISPDERYVRLGFGRDYGDVPPVHGIRYGVAAEQLDVSLQVQQ